MQDNPAPSPEHCSAPGCDARLNRGTDHFFNLVRACQKCNLRKNAFMCGTAFLLLTGG